MTIRSLLLATALAAVFLYAPPVFAHPGRTAADGCHYCRTNCDRWGVPWNERHCHGGSVVIPPVNTIPTNTPRPLPTWTPKPTATPTELPTPTVSPTPTLTPQPTRNHQATPTPQVLGASETNAGTAVVGILMLLGLGFFFKRLHA